VLQSVILWTLTVTIRVGLAPMQTHAVPACHQHAVEAIREQASRIVTAYQPNVALSVFTEASAAARRR
jgi:hypothetical protein